MTLTGRRLGVAVLARPTFDVPYAQEMANAALATLEEAGAELHGPRDLLVDADAAATAIETIKDRKLDGMVLVQATFTDASMTVALAKAIEAPLVLWAFPEQRTGGRLRLNSFCGINLAGHALRKAGLDFGYVFSDPRVPEVDLAIAEALDGRLHEAAEADPIQGDPAAGERIASALETARIGLIGEHPDGFETCAFDAGELAARTGAQVAPGDLPGLFEAAAAIDEGEAVEIRARVAANLDGVYALETDPLDKSLRSYAALKDKAEQEDIDAFAVRCWPEFFTEYGCAACGAMAMLGEEGTPCACEADVYGAASLLMLKAVADEPPFLADLVDIDPADDTVVFWHCGLAPLSLADTGEPPRATIHSNRRKPLLNEFALKPGPITVARLSQSKGLPRLVIGGGEMLDRPRSFSGTSGVARLSQPARDVLAVIMGEGLEHHFAFAYGDHRAALAGWAARADLPTVILG